MTSADRSTRDAEQRAAEQSSTPETKRHDPYAALRFRDFRLLAATTFLESLVQQMLAVAIGWDLYVRTHSAFALGLVGLVQVLPVIVLALPAGHIADQFDRRLVVLGANLLFIVAGLGLALLAGGQGPLMLIYGCILLLGASFAFSGAAGSALMSQTVPPEVFANAATWDSSVSQVSSVGGPALAGGLIALQGTGTPVYILCVGAGIIAVVLLLLMRSQAAVRTREAASLSTLLAGVGFLWQTQIILAAITLDLFAVLLGGATTLLPIFARDVLHVGAGGLGWLRAAPSIGALVTVLATTRRPPLRRAGQTLLVAVAGFGVATIVFGLSRSFGLSLLMLALLGALDNISVVIRSTLLLTRVPDAMRGRVSAVNSIFISGSNELGGFESGVAAALFGPTLAVVAGGVGTILVVLGVTALWPELRRLRNLSGDEQR